MMKKIKNIFKMIFETRKTKVMFCLSLMSFMLLITVTFAWFISIIELPNSTISTGNLSFVAKGYDENGNFISTIMGTQEYDPNDEDMINVNAPLFQIQNWQAGDATTCYISIENSGSLDLDFSLTFTISGTEKDKENIGGFWYRIEPITGLNYNLATYQDKVTSLKPGYQPKSAYYDNVIKDYCGLLTDEDEKVNSKKVVLCDEKCKVDDGNGNITYDHKCTENDKLSRNLITVDHLAEYGSLNLFDINDDENKHVCIYRIDLGLRKDATDPVYTNTTLSIQGQIYASQPGTLVNPDGFSTTVTVTDENSLKQALDNALPGDTILLGNKVNYNGDLIINKAVSINTYGNDLVVNGNLVYNFVSKHLLKINMSSGGNIYVKTKGNAGGNFLLNTPNSEVLITGNNYFTNLYVDKNVSINATNAKDTKGLFLSGANIYNSTGEPKDIDIESNTRITLDKGASLSLIHAVNKATNIEIINYGTIKSILLGNMMLLDDTPNDPTAYTNSIQVLVDNYNKIEQAIQLPEWAVPFSDTKNSAGNYPGNARVIREFGAYAMTIEGDEDPTTYFKNEDIVDYNLNEVGVVQEVEGSNDSLIVYYGEREGKTTTIDILLTEYFQEYYNESGLQVTDAIKNIRRLIIHSLYEKEVTYDDISKMNTDYLGLTDLDLSKAKIQNDTIPEGAFKDKVQLSKIVLPNTVTTILGNAFSGTGIKVFTFPASVTSWESSSVDSIRYIIFDSVVPVLPNDVFAFRTTATRWQYQIYFVDEAAVEKYRSSFYKDYTDNYFSFSTKFFPKGEFTDDGQHVVRQTTSGYELIFYGGNSKEIKCGFDLSLNGNKVYVTSIGEFCYSHVKTPFNVIFDDNVTYLSDFAFFNSKVKNIDFNNVRYIGNYAFYHNINITYLDTKNVREIGTYAFSMCSNLYEVKCPELLILNSYAFHHCIVIAQVSFYKLQVLKANAFYNKVTNINSQFDNNVVRLYFYNDTFKGVDYKSFINVNHERFKTFVRESEILDFKALKIVPELSVYKLGDICGTYEFSRSATIDDELVTRSINIGEYVICGDAENAQFVCYNKININEDYTVPSIGEYNIDDVTYRKTITSVGDYAFYKVKISNIKFEFGDTIKELGNYVFYDHSSTAFLQDSTYYNRIHTLELNNVEFVGTKCFYAMIHLKTVNAPKLRVISNDQFAYCNILDSVSFPNVEELYGTAFDKCKKLFTIDFPSIKKVTGTFAFRSCLELVSISFGENLTEFNPTNLFSNDMPKLREIIFKGQIKFSAIFYPSNNQSKNLHIYVPKESTLNQNSELSAKIRETGYRIGTYLIYNTDETLSFDIGEYTVNDVTIDNITGISISSYNVVLADIPSDYKLPNTIDSKKVIRLGHQSFIDFQFGAMDVSKFNSNENFVFNDNLLEVGPYAFASTTIQVSNFKNIRTIEAYAFNKCRNIYIVNAPELLIIGDYGFQQCSNIYNFDAKKLREIGYLTFNDLKNVRQLLTDIQVAPYSSWQNLSKASLVTFATTPGSTLSGTNFETSGYSVLKLTNPTMANLYTSAEDMLYSINDVLLAEDYQYQIFDGDGNVMYEFPVYRYAVNKSGSDIGIIKYLNAEFLDSDRLVIPGEFDGRPVTSFGVYSFSGRTQLDGLELEIPNSVKIINKFAFYDIDFIGDVDLKNVETIGVQAFQDAKFTTIRGAKVTSIGSSNFISDSNLKSVYFNSLSRFEQTQFNGSPNLNYIYTEVPIVFLNTTQWAHSDMTFVINAHVNSTADIRINNWSLFKNPTIFVPYDCVDIYKEVFADTSKYKGFNILPIGMVLTQEHADRPSDTFILNYVNGKYDYINNTYEQILEITNISSTNEDIIIPSYWQENEDSPLIPIVRLGQEALKGQNTIKNLTLSENISSYCDKTFDYGSGLENIYVNENNPYFISSNGVLYSNDNGICKELICYPKRHEGTEYTLEITTVAIRSNAFKDCAYLKNVTISSNVRNIGVNAFSGTMLSSCTFVSYAPTVYGMEIFDPNNTELIVYVPSSLINDFRTNKTFQYLKLVPVD